jgi:uncharacterized membrane protein
VTAQSGDGVMGKLTQGVQGLVSAATDRLMSVVQEHIGDLTDRLTDYAGGGGGPGKTALKQGMQKMQEGGSPIGAAASAVGAGGKEQVKQAFGGGGGGGDQGEEAENRRKTDLKVTNIIESVDVGVPVWLAYNQWTQFKDFPSYMKKVENVEQEEDEKLLWQAQVGFSHRSWESSIVEQVPDERIVWTSKADKGSVDGAVSFHELTPDLTRIMVVLQYHPKGFVEKTGNIWRAPGRRVRLELKHFVRQVMTQSVLKPDDVKGWRGEIREGQVVRGDEEGQQELQQRRGQESPPSEQQPPPQGEAQEPQGEEQQGQVQEQQAQGQQEQDQSQQQQGQPEEPQPDAS